MKRRQAHGFTLVEVLIVTASIGLISSLLLLVASGMSRQSNDLLKSQYAHHAVRQAISKVSRDYRNAEDTQPMSADFVPSHNTLMLSQVNLRQGEPLPAVVYFESNNRCWRAEVDAEGVQHNAHPVTPENMLAQFESLNPGLLKVSIQWEESRGQSAVTRQRSVLVSKR